MLKEKEQSVGLVAQLQPERSLERRLNCSKNWQIWALAASVPLALKSPYKRSSEIGFPLKKKIAAHAKVLIVESDTRNIRCLCHSQ